MSVPLLYIGQDEVIPYDEDVTGKQSLNSVRRTKDLSNKGLMQKDSEHNQVDFEDVNLIDTGLNYMDEEADSLSKDFKRRFRKGTEVGKFILQVSSCAVLCSIFKIH